MIIRKAEFLESRHKFSAIPKSTVPEYAFIGRSNVGKSSLINMLTQKKGLAKTSSTPGKTQCLVFFNINDNFLITDLPGYGYAKVAKKIRTNFGTLITEYFLKRENLANTFILIDSRIPPQKKDLDFMAWLNKNGIPFSIIFTKIDKLSKNKLNINVDNYKNELLKYWEETPNYFLSSSTNNLGREDILNYIQSINIKIIDK